MCIQENSHNIYIKFWNYKFNQHKSLISINNVGINKIVAYSKAPFGKPDVKYFIGYKDARKIRPLCVFLPKISAYRRNFNKTKCMSYLVIDKNLLKNYNKIREKVRNSIKKNLIVNL